MCLSQKKSNKMNFTFQFSFFTISTAESGKEGQYIIYNILAIVLQVTAYLKLKNEK